MLVKTLGRRRKGITASSSRERLLCGGTAGLCVDLAEQRDPQYATRQPVNGTIMAIYPETSRIVFCIHMVVLLLDNIVPLYGLAIMWHTYDDCVTETNRE
jgi:hypothetical protein